MFTPHCPMHHFPSPQTRGSNSPILTNVTDSIISATTNSIMKFKKIGGAILEWPHPWKQSIRTVEKVHLCTLLLCTTGYANITIKQINNIFLLQVWVYPPHGYRARRLNNMDWYHTPDNLWEFLNSINLPKCKAVHFAHITMYIFLASGNRLPIAMCM